MKLEIWKKENPILKIIRFKLIEQKRFIELIIVDKNGYWIKRGSILRIYDDGTLRRSENINEKLGFKLTKEGYIEFK